jgi:hypothetical protein
VAPWLLDFTLLGWCLRLRACYLILYDEEVLKVMATTREPSSDGPGLYQPLAEERSIRLLTIDLLEEVVSCRLGSGRTA